MFTLLRRWFGWDGIPSNNPDDRGIITRSVIFLNLTHRATIVIAPERTIKAL